jgi:hypothetical protein
MSGYWRKLVVLVIFFSIVAVGPSFAASDKSQLLSAYGKFPLSFEENMGQTDKQVKFLSRGSGYTLFLTPTEAVLSLRSELQEVKEKSDNARRERESRKFKTAVIRMKLHGANKNP